MIGILFPILIVTTTLLALPSPASAQDDFFNSLALDLDSNDRPARSLQLLGWISEKVAWGYADPGPQFSRQESGLSKVETSLFAQLDWRPVEGIALRASAKSYHDLVFQLEPGVLWTASERRTLRNRHEVRDLYLEMRPNEKLYVKAGNQIFSWGMSEFMRVTDLINVEDQLGIGQQDLEDLRLQVPALLLGANAGDWLLETVISHSAGSDLVAPTGDEFDPYLGLDDAGLSLHRPAPGNPIEYFFRASTHYSRGDLQLVAGDFNDNRRTPSGLKIGTGLQPFLELRQHRMQVLGVAANLVSGSWLLFGEAGLHFNTPVAPARVEDLIGNGTWQKRDLLLGVLGAEYNGFSNLVLSMELDFRRIQSNHDRGLNDRAQTSFGARLHWTAFNDRLEMLGAWNELAKNQGHIARFSVDYNLNDALTIGALWVDYDANRTSLLYSYRNNDVIQLQLRYSFLR